MTRDLIGAFPRRVLRLPRVHLRSRVREQQALRVVLEAAPGGGRSSMAGPDGLG